MAQNNNATGKSGKKAAKKGLAHTQIEGTMMVDEAMMVRFDPNDAVTGEVKPFRSVGRGQMLSDGTFEYETVKRVRHNPKLMCKLDHGRLSETYDDAYLLTIKIYKDEDLDTPTTMMAEALQASVKLRMAGV